MKKFFCSCGQPLYYENDRCLACGQEVGYCSACATMATLTEIHPGVYRCGNAACGTDLVKCANWTEYNVCNRCIALHADGTLANRYCDCCRYNYTIPDLKVPGNWTKWYRLEVAKRRLFYDLDLLKLPHGRAADGYHPSLSFDFKADVIPAQDMWHAMGREERVYTGHASGHITINIREADEVERERLRVDMGESHRTLIGHFRHEIAHYYWEMLVKGRCEGAFVVVFGDHRQGSYADAMDAYYQNGPPPDWSQSFVSAYASMHPWEDWAETFSYYVAMVSALDTANHFELMPGAPYDNDDLMSMITLYQRLGIALNEMSRTMGLLDMSPGVPVWPVVRKMEFIHSVLATAR